MEAAAADIAFIVGEASMELLLFDDGGEEAAAADAAIAAAVADAGMVGAAGAYGREQCILSFPRCC